MSKDQTAPASREVPQVTPKLLFEIHRATPVPGAITRAAVTELLKRCSDVASNVIRTIRK